MTTATKTRRVPQPRASKRNSAAAAAIATEIRSEIRRIIRKWSGLQTPLQTFRQVERPEGGPSIQVCFRPSLRGDRPPEPAAAGLCFRTNEIGLPDERIDDAFYDFAGSVWHLSARIHKWDRAIGTPTEVVKRRIKKHVDDSTELKICGDLITEKKHAAREERSGLKPWLYITHFDTSANGLVAFWYDGTVKEAVLLVSSMDPVPFRVDVYRGDDPSINRDAPDAAAKIGSAVDIISTGFQHWLPLIRDLGILESDDPESNALVQILKPFCELRPEGGATSNQK